MQPLDSLGHRKPDQELFHCAMSEFGGEIDFDKLNTRASQLVKYQVERAKSLIASAHSRIPSLPPIYLGVVANLDVGAWACKYRDRYFIGLAMGSFKALHFLFSRMLAERTILPQIGDLSEESHSISPLPLKSITNGSGGLIMPRNSARKLFALHLENIAIDFLTSHELTHIAQGHCDLLDELGYSGFVSELGFRPRDAEDALMFQTLEMDADCGATSTALGSIKIKLTDPNFIPTAPWDSMYSGIRQCAFDWAFAVYTFFRIFGDDTICERDIISSTHPPFSARHFIASTTASSFVIEKWDRELVREFNQGASEALVAVEQAFAKITGEKTMNTGLLGAYGGSGWEYTKTLIANWKSSLRGQLLPHAYGKLAD